VNILAQNFLSYLRSADKITHDDAEKILEMYNKETEKLLYAENDDPPEIKLGRMVVDAGIMSAEEMEDIRLLYKSTCILEEYKIAMPEEMFADAFIDEYITIMQEGFHRIYKLDVKFGEKRIAEFMNDEVFISQFVIGNGDNHFLAGIAAKELVLQTAAVDLYDLLKEDLKLPVFGGTKEDTVDLFTEFLNNVNGFCTFKFNVGFDLRLPEFRERAELSAPRIHIVPANFLSHSVDVFLIYGASYKFKKGV